MVFRRRRQAAQRKRKAGMKRRAYRRRTPIHTFTELFEAGTVQVGTGGTWKVAFNSLPQASQYSNLFKQFCIKRFQVMLLPTFNSNDPSLVVSGTEMPRLAYAINDSPMLQDPINELSVLTSNGAKVITAGHKTTITCVPKPDIYSAALGKPDPVPVATRWRGNVWLNTDAAEVGFSGTSVQHSGISYWLSGGPLSIPYTQYNVYYKLTVALRDPA